MRLPAWSARRAPERQGPRPRGRGIAMNPTLLLVCFLLAAAVAILARLRQPAAVIPVWRSTPAAPTRTRAAARAPAPIASPAPPGDDRGLVEWDRPVAGKAAQVAVPRHQVLAARLRDRYVVARFPGLHGGAAGLLEVEQVIKAARLYFDEGKIDRALELLDLAGQRSPAEKAFPL